MSLPPAQQHTLDAIEDVLQGGDPRLARMFAVFTRLTRHEGMPVRETLAARPWWLLARRPVPPPAGRRAAWRLGAKVLVPLLLAATLSLLILSIVGAPRVSHPACGSPTGRAADYGSLAPLGCPAAHRGGAAQTVK
jgi:hypothetical protein